MKEAKLKIIIILMSLALIGLIAVQIYWIKNAIELESNLFDYNAIQALNSVVKEISENESADFIVHKIIGPQKETMTIVNSDSVNNGNYIFTQQGKLISQYSYSDKNSNMRIDLKSVAESDSSNIVIEYNSFDQDGKSKTTGKKIISAAQLDSIKTKKSIFVNKVVNDLIWVRNKQPIESRIKEKELSHYLQVNLNNNGISTDFIFAVESEERDSLIFNKNKADSEELKNTSYKARLFPDELFNKPDQLLLYFPDRTEYLLRSASTVLIISALLIIAIIALYYKTVKILISQKKIADIKSDFINNITHEFKTPISTISLATEALQEPELSDKKYYIDKYAAMIKEESNRLKTMVDSLLNTAIMDSGVFAIERAEINIHSIINEITEKNRLRLNNNSDIIDLEFKADKYLISGDRLHITNMLNNVIDNSIKYSGDIIRINILTENTDKGILITISDNGIGIEKHQQKKIFDTFYRVQQGNIQNVRGYGIGLSYVKKIVEVHNGSISVESKIGKGAAFKIFLPYE